VRSIRIIGVVKRVVAFSDMNRTRCASRQVYREALKVSERAIGQSSLVSSAQDHARRMVARHSSPSLSEMNASIAICTTVGPVIGASR
jgi:predicted GNAT family N-acyltransferase